MKVHPRHTLSICSLLHIQVIPLSSEVLVIRPPLVPNSKFKIQMSAEQQEKWFQ